MDVLEGELLPASYGRRNELVREIRLMESSVSTIESSILQRPNWLTVSAFIVLIAIALILQLDNIRINNTFRELLSVRSKPVTLSMPVKAVEAALPTNRRVEEVGNEQKPIEPVKKSSVSAMANRASLDKKPSKLLIKKVSAGKGPYRAGHSTASDFSTMEFPEAEKTLKGQIAANPRNVTHQLLLADLYNKNGIWKKAESLYSELCPKVKRNSGCFYNLAISLDQQAKHSEALGFYRKAIASGRETGFERLPVLQRILEIETGLLQ